MDAGSSPDDFARPGHVFPLRARPGGVLERRGQTEAAVDLAGLAGLYPAGVICEIVNDDGTMARVPDLIRFCKTHGLVMITVADLARYRLESEFEGSLWAIDGSSCVCETFRACARPTMKGENMTELKSSQSELHPAAEPRSAACSFSKLSGNRVLSLNPDGSDRKVIVTECRLPDGIAVDVEGGHIYWTNMGVPTRNDGSIERADLDGRNRTTIVPQGGTFTPKQLKLEKKSGKLYWCDREGMRRDAREPRRVERSKPSWTRARATLDRGRIRRSGASASPSMPTAARFTGRKKAGTTRALGRIFRAGIDIPPGQTRGESHGHRSALRRAARADRPGDSISRIAACTGPTAATRRAATPSTAPPRRAVRRRARHPEILFTHLMEGIGIALDLKGGRMFLTDLAGSVYSARLDGSEKQTLLCAQGNLTGIAYVEIPQQEK